LKGGGRVVECVCVGGGGGSGARVWSVCGEWGVSVEVSHGGWGDGGPSGFDEAKVHVDVASLAPRFAASKAASRSAVLRSSSLRTRAASRMRSAVVMAGSTRPEMTSHRLASRVEYRLSYFC
jgi:hypothetical protein